MLRPGSRIQRRITYGVTQVGRADSLFDRLQLTTQEDAVVDDEDICRLVEQAGHSGRIAWTRLKDPTLDQSLDVRHRDVQVQREEARGEQSTTWNAHDQLEVAGQPRKINGNLSVCVHPVRHYTFKSHG